MKSGEIDGYDAVFLSPHKFVGGPGTPGILLMNKALYRLNSQPLHQLAAVARGPCEWLQ